MHAEGGEEDCGRAQEGHQPRPLQLREDRHVPELEPGQHNGQERERQQEGDHSSVEAAAEEADDETEEGQPQEGNLHRLVIGVPRGIGRLESEIDGEVVQFLIGPQRQEDRRREQRDEESQEQASSGEAGPGAPTLYREPVADGAGLDAAQWAVPGEARAEGAEADVLGGGDEPERGAGGGDAEDRARVGVDRQCGRAGRQQEPAPVAAPQPVGPPEDDEEGHIGGESVGPQAVVDHLAAAAGQPGTAHKEVEPRRQQGDAQRQALAPGDEPEGERRQEEDADNHQLVRDAERDEAEAEPIERGDNQVAPGRVELGREAALVVGEPARQPAMAQCVDGRAFLRDVEGVIDRGIDIREAHEGAIGAGDRLIGVPIARAELQGQADEQDDEREPPGASLPGRATRVLRPPAGAELPEGTREVEGGTRHARRPNGGGGRRSGGSGERS
ncbi:MAG: hypothetical protein AVDCRST_MAG88-169, partial [uncultured Thermomicrobiales bacterium]